MLKSFLITVLLVFSSVLFAQEADTIRKVTVPQSKLSDTIIIKPDTVTKSNIFKQDTIPSTTLPDTIRNIIPKPRISDTVRGPRILRSYTLSHDFSEEIPLPVDTIFTMSQRYRRSDKYSPVNAMLGNYGLPFYQINFFDRVSDPDKFLYAYYYPLMYVPETSVFMDTQVPFTELFWTIAGQRQNSEQTFRVKHSQNINRFWNFGLIYDIIFSLGQYNYQRSDDKDFTFFTAYKGERYKIYFSAGLNNLTSFENGGIQNYSQLQTFSNMRDVEVYLGGTSNAKSFLKNRSILLVQRYTIGAVSSGSKKKEGETNGILPGLSGTFSHILTMESNKRTYTDEFPASGFYDTIYIGSPTFDSLYSSNIKNTLRFDFALGANRKFKLGGGGGIRSEAFRFSQLVPTFDTTHVGIAGRGRISNALTGRLYNSIGTGFRWVATGDLYFSGYRKGDFNIDGIITRVFDLKKGPADWNITGSIANRQPSYWMQNWGSNNFYWMKNLDKEFRMNIGTSFNFPARHTGIRFNYAIIDNYTGFDTTAIPFQHTGGLSVGALTISKDIRAWKFHLATDFILQKSSNTDVLDLPLLATRTSAYFEHLLKFPATNGELNTQIGIEALYHSEYHPYRYMPATGRFYNQTGFTAGNYPFINLFINLKLKRTRIFIMFDHFNARKMGYNFFMVPDYPMNISMLRYGFAWTFYD
jgi:hypothetical protein